MLPLLLAFFLAVCVGVLVYFYLSSQASTQPETRGSTLPTQTPRAAQVSNDDQEASDLPWWSILFIVVGLLGAAAFVAYLVMSRFSGTNGNRRVIIALGGQRFLEDIKLREGTTAKEGDDLETFFRGMGFKHGEKFKELVSPETRKNIRQTYYPRLESGDMQPEDLIRYLRAMDEGAIDAFEEYVNEELLPKLKAMKTELLKGGKSEKDVRQILLGDLLDIFVRVYPRKDNPEAVKRVNDMFQGTARELGYTVQT